MAGLVTILVLVGCGWFFGFWNTFLGALALLAVGSLILFINGLAHRRLCKKEGQVVGTIWYHMRLAEQEKKPKKGNLKSTNCFPNNQSHLSLLSDTEHKDRVHREIASRRSIVAKLKNAQTTSSISRLNIPTEIPPTPSIRSTNKILSTGCGTFRFSYIDFNDNYSYRTVTVFSYSDGYFEGHCHSQNATRTFRTKRVVGELTDAHSGEILTTRQWMARIRKHPANPGNISGLGYLPEK